MLISAVEQHKSAIIIHIAPPSWAFIPSSHPSPLGHHRVPSWAPCVIQQLLNWILKKIIQISVNLNDKFTHEQNTSIVMLCYAKSLQSCPTLCDPIDGSPPCSPVPGILQARTLEWVAISFSNAWKWKVKVKSLSRCVKCTNKYSHPKKGEKRE